MTIAAMSSDAQALRGISSMATRQVLAELAQAWAQQGGMPLAIESVGGVDAARRVADGEALDLVFLAADALARLEAAGHVLAGSVRPLMRSGVAVAVAAGAPLPDIGSAEALRAAVLAAPTVGYSTGPSGTALLALFERWGVRAALEDRLVQAPAGVPVARLVAEGRVALGFQQLSELLGVPGIQIVGRLPEAVQIHTVFAGALTRQCKDPQRQAQAHAALAFMAEPAAAGAKQRQGMDPA